MYAVIETGGKQFRVEKGNTISVEKLDAKKGDEITLDKVLLLGGEERHIGTPYVAGATVRAEVVDQGRGPKVLVYKRRRRKDSKTMHGHRQYCTFLRIGEISFGAGQTEKGAENGA